MRDLSFSAGFCFLEIDELLPTNIPPKTGSNMLVSYFPFLQISCGSEIGHHFTSAKKTNIVHTSTCECSTGRNVCDILRVVPSDTAAVM